MAQLDGFVRSEAFPGHTMFRTFDVDHAAEQVGRMYSPHTMRLMDNAPDFSCEMESVQLGPVTLNHLAYSSPAVLTSSDPESYYAVNWPVGGRADVWQDEDVVTGPDRASVLNAEGPIRFRWSEDLELLSARIDSAALMAHLGRVLGIAPAHPLRFDHPMELTGSAVAWLAALDALEDLVFSPDDAATNPLLSAPVEQEILTGLLFLQPNNYSRQLWALPAHAPAREVRRTAELVEATPELPHTDASMAEEAGVGVRSLRDAFGRHLGTAPPEFLADIRLARAHDELRSADPGATTVPEVALRWGFGDVGRFAGSYAQRYGTSPAQTLQAG
jgi:AraC-like DNA-binding protein